MEWQIPASQKRWHLRNSFKEEKELSRNLWREGYSKDEETVSTEALR